MPRCPLRFVLGRATPLDDQLHSRSTMTACSIAKGGYANWTGPLQGIYEHLLLLHRSRAFLLDIDYHFPRAICDERGSSWVTLLPAVSSAHDSTDSDCSKCAWLGDSSLPKSIHCLGFSLPKSEQAIGICSSQTTPGCWLLWGVSGVQCSSKD